MPWDRIGDRDGVFLSEPETGHMLGPSNSCRDGLKAILKGMDRSKDVRGED